MKNFIFKYAGVMAIPVYIAFTFASHLNNTMINPLTFWLSDYGNVLVNPNGAFLYNAGCVATALLLAVFYIGIYRWYKRERTARKFNISFAIAQTAGLMGSFFLIMSAIYTLGLQTELHKAFSTANMIAMDFFLSFVAVAFLMNPRLPKIIGIIGFMTCFFNIFTMNAFTDLYVSEWIFFLLFMVNLVLMTVYYDRLISRESSVYK